MKSKLYLAGACAALFLVAATVLAEEAGNSTHETAADHAEPVKQAAEKAAAAAPVAKPGTPVALTMEAIQELEDRKNALDSRERLMNERAKALEIQEKVLKDKLHRMEELNKKMAERLDTFKKDHEQKVLKLVSVVETMKPQAAAAYVEQLDAELAVEILARIQVQKAAKILNLVDKKMSARLTELYTGYRESIDDAPNPVNSAPASDAGKIPAGAPAPAPTAKEDQTNNTSRM